MMVKKISFMSLLTGTFISTPCGTAADMTAVDESVFAGEGTLIETTIEPVDQGEQS